MNITATLAAENATLRAENEELDFLRHEGGPDSVAAMEIELATLRASEAAAMERVKVLTEALRNLEIANDNLCGARPQKVYDLMISAGMSDRMTQLDFARNQARRTLTADKEPKT